MQNSKNRKLFPGGDLNPGPCGYEANALTTTL